MRDRLSRVSRRSPCAVCGRHDKACLFRPDGSGVLCSQRASDRPARGGCIQAWWHYFDDPARPLPKAAPASPPKSEQFRAPVDHVNAIYTALLRAKLELSDTHRQSLLARGLSSSAIDDQGYVSTPTETHGDLIAREMGNLDLSGVPGFFRDGGRWRMKRCSSGFFIPVRNERSQIVGLQIRCDDPKAGKYLWFSSANMREGTGSGAPVHFARPHLLPTTNEVLITEGSLKANLIGHFTGSPVVAAAGVGNFGADFGARLYALAPHATPIIAFDADWMIKPQVAAALEKIKKELKRAGFKIKVRTWPSAYKGLDDFLLACHASVSRLEVAA